jgi:hypothetical protein
MPTGTARTLKLKWPCGVTLGLAIAILICLIAGGEFLLRRDFVQAHLPYPSFGSNSRNLDMKLHLLKKMIEREGPPDCLFLGNSMVQTDIDPEAFREAYQTVSGNPIGCFNFGVNGMSPYPGAKFVKVLNRLFHPKIVIWGITPSDLKTRRTNKEVTLETGSWVRYQLGHGNFSGWLIDKSYFYRYYLRFRLWMDFPKIFRIHQKMETKSTAHGFLRGIVNNEFAKPIQTEREARFKKILQDFKIDRRILPMLHEAFRPTPGITFVLAEMPIHQKFFTYYNGGEKTHNKIISGIKRFADQRGIHFIPSNPDEPIMDKEWQNYNHLNISGARQFSRWLGKQIGAAVRKGLIPDPRRSRERE